eukprot:sb/3464935/
MANNSGRRLHRATEALLVCKAQAIVSCFLRSAVPPRVRVNLPGNIIAEIEKRVDDSKKFHRGLFYNAALHMVTMLLPFWKKFCFFLSVGVSEKDRALIQTVSGQAISSSSLGSIDERIGDERQEKLDNDLDFFIEISKWINLKSDMANNSGRRLHRATEALLVCKAQAIVSCFLRSAVPPRVRVNLPGNIIAEIEKRVDDSKKFHRGLFYNAALHMVTMLLPFWKKFCFFLSVGVSEKDRALIQTVSGQAISSSSLGSIDERIGDERQEKLGAIAEKKINTSESTSDGIKGIRGRAAAQDKILSRRDAFPLQTLSATLHTDQNLHYQFSLSSGICHLKFDNGHEIPQPCEVLLTPFTEEIEFLLSPLPVRRDRSTVEVPSSHHNSAKKSRSKREVFWVLDGSSPPATLGNKALVARLVQSRNTSRLR